MLDLRVLRERYSGMADLKVQSDLDLPRSKAVRRSDCRRLIVLCIVQHTVSGWGLWLSTPQGRRRPRWTRR